MKCPNCNHNIPNKVIAKHLGSKGGEKSKRDIPEEAQRKMQEGRKKKPKIIGIMYDVK